MSEMDQSAIQQAPQPQDVVQQPSTQQPQQVSTPSSSSLQPPLVSTPPAQPLVNAASENLQCQWTGCGERCPTAEALYEHVCERHVGRKSTNNLNLTCAWGQCRTTTVKRDHITSHIRVHVPLKPHKCEFCGKAFKRPQDLKKHVKTHADDSVIMRSPEPNGGSRAPQGPPGGDYNPFYGQGMGNQGPQNYYAPAMPTQDYAAHHAANQYYQPQQTGQHPGYAPVTYYGPPAPQSTYDYETRKRGYDALDHFFGQVKRREFDPINFHSVSRRLYELQGLQLPQIIPPSLNVPAYQPVSAAIGGGYESADPIQAYSLPPMGNAKSRGDLTSIDQILEQMQATIYENDTHLAQSGIGQAGANYIAYRTSNSPPSSSAYGSQASGIPHQHNPSIASASEQASTPGLTPPSSAQSYTSGQSPLTGSANPAYPSLPSSAEMAYAAANAATLSSIYENDRGRRIGGSELQRAAPDKEKADELMESPRDGSITPPASTINKSAKGKKKVSAKDSNIDPALSGEASTPTSEDKLEQDREQIWVQNMRLIEWMRDFIKKRLESGEYDNGQNASSEIKEENQDTAMTGTEEESDKKDAEQLYPVLQHVNEETA